MKLATLIPARFLLLLLAGITALPQGAAYAVDLARRLTFDIQAQPLPSALMQFSTQSGVEFSVATAAVEGRQAAAVRGIYTTDEALSLLLTNTGLEFELIDDGTVAIRSTPVKTSARETNDALKLAQVQAGASTPQPSSRPTQDTTQEMVITGTHIRGLAPDSAPVLVYDREAIARTGYSTTEQFIRSLPQNFNAGISEESYGNSAVDGIGFGTTGGAGVNLRGLGQEATLVLLNGRRLAPSGALGNFVDISMIPLSAVERIEVLTVGASALYGSDAVGGAVNFILRENFDGAETSARIGTLTSGDGDEWQFGQTLGHRWNSGDAVLTYERLSRDPLLGRDRSYVDPIIGKYPLIPSLERHSVFAAARQRLGERVELFSNGYFLQRKSERMSDTAFFLDTKEDSQGEQYGGTLGAKIGLPRGWELELAGIYSDSTSTLIRTAVDGVTTQSDSDAVANSISLDAKIDGTLFALPAGEAKLALGAQTRKEEFSRLNRGVLSGALADRRVNAAFAEMFVPLAREAGRGLRRLELTAAARYEDYDDVGSTADPQVGLLWSPIRDLSLRGTWGTSFRAPTLFEQTPTRVNALLQIVPDPQGTGGQSIVLISQGWKFLTPEESETYTLGFDYAPRAIPGLRVQGTYFDTVFDGRIARPAFSAATVLQSSTWTDFIRRNPTPAQIQAVIDDHLAVLNRTNIPTATPFSAQVILDAKTQNTVGTATNGVDLEAGYGWQTSRGEWVASLSGTHIFHFSEKVSPNAPSQEFLDTIFQPVATRLRGRLSWGHGGWGVTTFLNYTDSYEDNRTATIRKIDAFKTVDLTVSYETAAGGKTSWLNGLRWSFGCINAFDADPPYVTSAFSLLIGNPGFDPANATPQGRQVSLGVTKSW